MLVPFCWWLNAFSRSRLALERQVSEQNRSRFVPQIAVPQEVQADGLVPVGLWQWGQSRGMARNVARVAGRVKWFLRSGLGAPDRGAVGCWVNGCIVIACGKNGFAEEFNDAVTNQNGSMHLLRV